MTFENDPRTVEDEAEALVERLLRAGRADGPSSRALAAAPGAVAALLSSQLAAAAGLAQAGAGGAAAAGAQAGKALIAPLFVLKWIGAGALASSSALALFGAVQSGHTSEPRAIVNAAPVVRVAVAAGAEVAPQPVLSTPQPVVSVPVVATALAPQADLAREVAALDAARQALVEGDAALALRQLSSLERAPKRALVPEATVLRVRALLAQGDSIQARRVAEQFLAAAPTSPQASVVRRLIENSQIQPAGSRL